MVSGQLLIRACCEDRLSFRARARCVGLCDEKEVPSVVILFDRADCEISALPSTTCGL